MRILIAAILVCTVGCGAILNGGSATITVPAGATIDGDPSGQQTVSKQVPHLIAFPDGRRCVIESNVSAGYVIADVVLWFLVGLIVDGVTGDWKVLNADQCPGVMVQ